MRTHYDDNDDHTDFMDDVIEPDEVGTINEDDKEDGNVVKTSQE